MRRWGLDKTGLVLYLKTRFDVSGDDHSCSVAECSYLLFSYKLGAIYLIWQQSLVHSGFNPSFWVSRLSSTVNLSRDNIWKPLYIILFISIYFHFLEQIASHLNPFHSLYGISISDKICEMMYAFLTKEVLKCDARGSPGVSCNPISSVPVRCLRVVLHSDLTTQASIDVRSTSYSLIFLLSLLDSLNGEKEAFWTRL